MIDTKTCPESSFWQQLAKGQVGAVELARLQQHLAQCPRCQDLWQKLKPGDARAATVADHAAENRHVDTTTDRAAPAAADRESETGPDLTFLAPSQGPGELGRLGGYRILKVLGQGGMGLVFQAEDIQLERLVAIKVMKPEVAKNPAARQRFLREAKACAALRNDHVVDIHQVSEDRGVPFLAMEYLEGLPLDKWLAGGRRATVAQVLRMARDLAKGLAAAHAKNLIHRDIKPANIWLDKSTGRLKILDFGLARSIAEQEHITQTGAVVGTPAFMSPEQARGEPFDHRSDLFSLGSVLYRLLAGRQPFAGHTTMAILTSLAVDAPQPVRELNPDVPTSLESLVMQLLAKKPEQRPASAQRVVETLQLISTEITSSVTAASSRPAQGPDPTFAVAESGKIVSLPRAPSPPAAPSNRGARRRFSRGPLIAIAAGVLLIATVVTAQIVIRIRDRDGRETRIEVPGDKQVIVEKKGKTIFKAPDDPAVEKKSPPVAVASDPHRRAAEMVLKHGGTVSVLSSAGHKSASRIEDLPTGSFVLSNVYCVGREIPDDVMQAFEGVHYVSGAITLNSCKLTDAGVRHLRNVRSPNIDLNNNAITDESVRLLAEWPDLAVVQIATTSITDAAVPLLLKLARLRELVLAGSKITDDGIKTLASHQSLRHITLGDPITAKGLFHFKQSPCLQAITFYNLGDECVEALSTLTQVRLIVIVNSQITDEGARRIQKALPRAVIVHKGVPPSEAEHAAIHWALAQKAEITTTYGSGPLTEIPKTSFFVIGLMLPEGSPKYGAEKLRGIRSIRTLGWSGLENAEAEHIATLDSLIDLHLGSSKLAMNEIAQLTALKQLEALDLLGTTTIMDESLKHLARFEHLRALHVSDSPITDAGLELITGMKALQVLALGACPKLTGTGLKNLATLPVLRRLNLGRTPIDDTAIASLKLLSNLRILEVHETKLTAAGIAELQKALPKCAIFWDGGVIVPGANNPAPDGARLAADPDRALAEWVLSKGASLASTVGTTRLRT